MAKKKKFIPTKRKRMKDKQSEDMLTIQLLSMIDEVLEYQSTVSLSDLIKNLNEQTKP